MRKKLLRILAAAMCVCMVATACGGSGRGAITCPTGVAKGSPVTTVDTAKSGNLVNWKAGALYHLTENGNVYINYAASGRQQLRPCAVWQR